MKKCLVDTRPAGLIKFNYYIILSLHLVYQTKQ